MVSSFNTWMSFLLEKLNSLVHIQLFEYAMKFKILKIYFPSYFLTMAFSSIERWYGGKFKYLEKKKDDATKNIFHSFWKAVKYESKKIYLTLIWHLVFISFYDKACEGNFLILCSICSVSSWNILVLLKCYLCEIHLWMCIKKIVLPTTEVILAFHGLFIFVVSHFYM